MTFFLQDHKFVFNEQKKSDILTKIKLIYSSFTDLMDLDLENLTDPHSAATVDYSTTTFYLRLYPSIENHQQQNFKICAP